MNLNTTLSIITVIVCTGLVLLLYRHKKNERPELAAVEKLTMDSLRNYVKVELAELTKEENTYGLSNEEWEAGYARKKRINAAMRQCLYGIPAYKIIVKDLMRNIISKKLADSESVSELIDFTAPYLESNTRWEILMYFLKKKYKKDALSYLIKKYEWDRVRYDIEDGTVAHHLVTIEDLNYAYAQEILEAPTYYEQLDIMATLVYIRDKGFGCIDTLCEQNIDGITIGTSGSIISVYLDADSELPEAPRSIWIYYEGKYIHLDFLTTYTEEEMRRIVILLCLYRNPGTLTEKRGYLVNTMFDKTRVLAIRPGAGEYWAAFLRKFNIQNVTLEKLYIQGDDEVGAQLPVELIKWLMIGRITCAYTGRQGSGKTTAMIGAASYIDARLTLRVLEIAPEMYMRERYPHRNIYSVSETQYVSAEELQDALKKSDASISIVGEVASNAIAARMIQMGQVASLFTIFSHHAKRAKDLINAITNSIVDESGGGATSATVQPQVIDVIKIDIHMDFDVTGFRYFERITEIHSTDKFLPKYDPKDPVNSMNRITRAYYELVAVGEQFYTQDIVVYNRDTKKYEAVKWLSKDLTEDMLKNIPQEKVAEFTKFVTDNWEG